MQGDRAVPEILRALTALDARADVDVIVITRGGGSLEDLLPFSDEGLCRAIAACSTVVVSAVGHERDVPLCDLVADRRASTPTDAARLIVPDARQELENVERLRSSARRCAERVVVRARERLEALAARPALRSPDYWVVSRREALARLRSALDGAPQRALAVRAAAQRAARRAPARGRPAGDARARLCDRHRRRRRGRARRRGARRRRAGRPAARARRRRRAHRGGQSGWMSPRRSSSSRSRLRATSWSRSCSGSRTARRRSRRRSRCGSAARRSTARAAGASRPPRRASRSSRRRSPSRRAPARPAQDSGIGPT